MFRFSSLLKLKMCSGGHANRIANRTTKDHAAPHISGRTNEQHGGEAGGPNGPSELLNASTRPDRDPRGHRIRRFMALALSV